MAWSDEPTDMQLGTIFSWLSWKVDRITAQEAVKWLQNTATRRDVSAEMNRLRDLRQRNLLDASNCFLGEIWEGFDHD